MSNFLYKPTPVTPGLTGQAPMRFTAATTDSFATITAAGYVNDLAQANLIKPNDVIEVNYSCSSATPSYPLNVQGNGVYAEFIVVYSASNWSLVTPTGARVRFDITVGQAALASAAHVTLNGSSGTMQFRISNLWANKVGTNFSGGGGDRLLQITDGTTVYSVIPATNIQTLVNSGWGISTPLPYPASASINTPTAAGASLYAAYSGGTTDYTAGSIVLSGELIRVA